MVVSEFLLYQCGLVEDDESRARAGAEAAAGVSQAVLQARPDGAPDQAAGEHVTREEQGRARQDLGESAGSARSVRIIGRADRDLEQVRSARNPGAIWCMASSCPSSESCGWPGDEDRKSLWDPLAVNGDCMLPVETAMNLADDAFGSGATGRSDKIVVLVDDEDDTRAVYDRIRKTGLNAFAPLEEVDRERLTYMLGLRRHDLRGGRGDAGLGDGNHQHDADERAGANAGNRHHEGRRRRPAASALHLSDRGGADRRWSAGGWDCWRPGARRFRATPGSIRWSPTSSPSSSRTICSSFPRGCRRRYGIRRRRHDAGGRLSAGAPPASTR